MKKNAQNPGRAHWSTLVAEFESKPCNHAQFCKNHDVSIGNFRSWLYKLRSEQKGADTLEPGFVELVVSSRQVAKSSACSLVVGKVELHFDALPSPEYLAELLHNVAR